MDRAECVLDEDVRQAGETVGEGVVVLGLAGFEAGVLEEEDGPLGELCYGLVGGRSRGRVARERRRSDL